MSNPEMWGAVAADPSLLERKRKTAPKKKRKPLPHASEKQTVLNERWAFIRAAFLCCQLRDGGYHCQMCGTFYESPRSLQLHHLVRRGRGGDYTPGNAVLLGSGPGTCQCHERADGNLPQFSASEAS